MNESNQNIEFETLLDYLKRCRGFDFSGYKRSSLMRRINKRMQTVNIQGYNNYIDFLEVHTEEFNHLFNTILINVTSFWRDRTAWEYVKREIIPQILSRKAVNEQIRIWSAACASGEEAYTLAMLMAEIIGIDEFRERVKIYATDVDEEALNQARQATYEERDLTGLTPEEIETFFELVDTTYSFRKDLRRSVIFGRHDLIQDAPISKIDLLVCRNSLMYFNAETQSKILARFHFALRDGGFLFLGKAEMLLSHGNTFTPVNLKNRIFTKVPKLNLQDRLMLVSQTGKEEVANHLSTQVRLRDAAFDSGPFARLILDHNNVLVLANEQARILLNLTCEDLGCPFRDLEISYRPVELRSCIEQVYSERQVVNLPSVQWQTSQGEMIFFDVQLSPLIDINHNILGISINFQDITRYKRLQAELEHSNQELEMAYEELQSTNEELETTNEELQSSNEELETTNEELQSTNEELETMNEELQSTNEELQTVNDELQRRGEELNEVNAFLQAILTSLKGGVVVVNRDLQVLIWNYKSEDLWGLRMEEALGQNFLNLDIGLPVDQLRQSIRICLSGEEKSYTEVILEAVNRRGRAIKCRVTCTPLIYIEGHIQGVILLMEEQEEVP